MSSATTPYKSKVVLVTGANRGVGYGIARRMALQYPTSHLRQSRPPTPLTIYLTARDDLKGQGAIESLREELRGEKVLAEEGGDTNLVYHPLDVDDENSRQSLLRYITTAEGKDGSESIDVLINNAGVALDGFDTNVVDQTFKTNYHSVARMTDLFTPQLRSEGRIVIIASVAGLLSGYSHQLVQRFRNAKSRDEVDSLAKEFQQAVRNGNHQDLGWKSAGYATSKACIIAFTRAMAQEWREKGWEKDQGKTINCCCPGYVNTGMTKGNGVLTLDQGAMTPVMLALDNLKGRSGGYWKDQKEREW